MVPIFKGQKETQLMISAINPFGVVLANARLNKNLNIQKGKVCGGYNQ